MKALWLLALPAALGCGSSGDADTPADLAVPDLASADFAAADLAAADLADSDGGSACLTAQPRVTLIERPCPNALMAYDRCYRDDNPTDFY